jgi:hypothetical protein
MRIVIKNAQLTAVMPVPKCSESGTLKMLQA